MRLPTRAHRMFDHAGTVVALAAACSLPLVAQIQKPTPSALPTPGVTIASSALERLLPALAGWTRGRVNSDRIDLSPGCAYSYADAIYTNGSMKVRITLADTAADPEALAIVATMVATLADGHAAFFDRTTIRRLTWNSSPAAMRWNAATLEGEFVVVIAGRWVVKAEGTGVESIDMLRGFVGNVDLKAFADLK